MTTAPGNGVAEREPEGCRLATMEEDGDGDATGVTNDEPFDDTDEADMDCPCCRPR